MTNRVYIWLLILCLGSIFFSCAPTKEGVYFRTYKEIENSNNPDRTYLIENGYFEKIEPGDYLFITVSTGDDKSNSFNQTVGQAVTDIELISYVVDKEGYIKLPYLNRVKVAQLSLTQAVDTLETGLSQFLYMPVVKINFSTSKISVLGEVNSPGVFTFNKKYVSIYQAIAYAGDIAPFGNRKNVSILRRIGNNVIKKQVDLTNAELLTSSWYQIQSNDVIYVEPLARKKWGIQTVPLGLFFSLISTFILIQTYINTR
jgi:polysaccharide biosynthesis/export protein